MEIIWDDLKAELNIIKHAVSFEEAATTLADPLAASYLDFFGDEERYITIGHSTRSRLLLVVWCGPSKEQIRIISARKTTKQERFDYEKGV